MSCEKHKKTVEKYDGDLKALAEDIGNLHYEALAVFFSHLATKINIDGLRDYEGGRKKIARELFDAANEIRDTKEKIWNAWKISEPFMKDKHL